MVSRESCPTFVQPQHYDKVVPGLGRLGLAGLLCGMLWRWQINKTVNLCGYHCIINSPKAPAKHDKLALVGKITFLCFVESVVFCQPIGIW